MSVGTPTGRGAARGISTVEDSSAEDELPLDVIFDVLSNNRRRIVLRELQEGDGTTTLGALAERIAAHENGKPERALSSAERKRVYICLYQCHLPKMDDARVIDFDGDRKIVQVGPALAQVTRYLPPEAGADESERRWSNTVTGIASLASRLVPSP